MEGVKDLMKYYLLDSWDKQLVGRVPYFIAVALVIYLSHPYLGGYSDVAKPWLIYIVGVAAVVFLISNQVFNSKISSTIEKGFDFSNLRKFIQKTSNIFEGDTSFLGDVDGIKSRLLLASAFISGFMITVIFVGTALLLLATFTVDEGIILLLLIFVVLYIYRDITNPSFFKDEAVQSSPFIADLIETYMVKNSLDTLPLNKNLMEIFAYLVAKLFSPLIYVNMPKFSFKTILVHHSGELKDLFDKYIQAGEKQDSESRLCLKYLNSNPSVDVVLDGAVKGKEKISILIEQSPKENLPYLLETDMKSTAFKNRTWAAFTIRDNKHNRDIGCLFVEAFKGGHAKATMRKGKIENFLTSKVVYLITMIGERQEVEYLLSRIDIATSKFDFALLKYDVED